MRAAAIVMPLPRRVAGASLFGKTLETVLDRAAMPGDHRVHPGRQRRTCSLCRDVRTRPTASTAPEIVVSWFESGRRRIVSAAGPWPVGSGRREGGLVGRSQDHDLAGRVLEQPCHVRRAQAVGPGVAAATTMRS